MNMSPLDLNSSPQSFQLSYHRSPEGVPWGAYYWKDLLVALPISLVIDGFLAVVRLWVREEPATWTFIKGNPIVVLFHHECMITLASHYYDAQNQRNRGGILGFHGFLSYLTFTWSWRKSLPMCRFDRLSPQKPLNQVIDYLKELRGPFYVRTDAGGPYGRVRASIVEMALATGRSVVCLRQQASRTTTVIGHAVPLPGALTETRVSPPVTAAELQTLGRDQARDHLQSLMDGLF